MLPFEAPCVPWVAAGLGAGFGLWKGSLLVIATVGLDIPDALVRAAVAAVAT